MRWKSSRARRPRTPSAASGALSRARDRFARERVANGRSPPHDEVGVGRSVARGVIGWTWAASIALTPSSSAARVGSPSARSRSARRAPPRLARAPAWETRSRSSYPVCRTARSSRRTSWNPRGDPPPPVGGAPSPSLDQDRRGRGGDPPSTRPRRTSAIATIASAARPISSIASIARRSLASRRTPIARARRGRIAARRRSRWRAPRSSRRDRATRNSATRAQRRQSEPRRQRPRRAVGARRRARRRPSIRATTRPTRAPRSARRTKARPRAPPRASACATGAPAAITDSPRASRARARRHHRRGQRLGRAPRPPRDDVDSDQEVAAMVHSIVHASTAGGAQGAGRGGTANGGEAGAAARSAPARRGARWATATSGGT